MKIRSDFTRLINAFEKINNTPDRYPQISAGKGRMIFLEAGKDGKFS